VPDVEKWGVLRVERYWLQAMMHISLSAGQKLLGWFEVSLKFHSNPLKFHSDSTQIMLTGVHSGGNVRTSENKIPIPIP